MWYSEVRAKNVGSRLVHLVYLVYLVYLVCLVDLVDLVDPVSLVQPNKRDRPDKPNNVLLMLLASGGLDGTKIPVRHPGKTDLIQQCSTLSAKRLV